MNQVQLGDLLIKRFDDSEIRQLCWNLGLDYEELDGKGKSGKIRELIQRQYRHSQLPQLLRAIMHMRKDIQFSSQDLEDAEVTITEHDEESEGWIAEAVDTQVRKEAEREAVLTLLNTGKLPADLRAALQFIIRNI